MSDIKNYSSDALNIISSVDKFLSYDDSVALKEMAIELQDTFEKKQIWRTETEIEISVLNDIKFPTRASKYWQCVREQSVFFENLVSLSFEYRRNLLKIERIEHKIAALKAWEVNENISAFEAEMQIKELTIDLEECHYLKKHQEVQAKDRIRELKIWSAKKKEFDDSTFDTKDVNTHQLLSYTEMFLKNMFTVGNNGSIDERINLEGQLITALRSCQKHGLVEDILNKFNDEQKAIILKNLKIISNEGNEK